MIIFLLNGDFSSSCSLPRKGKKDHNIVTMEKRLAVGACFCLPTFGYGLIGSLYHRARESPDHVCRYLRPNGWFLPAINGRRQQKKKKNFFYNLDTQTFFWPTSWPKKTQVEDTTIAAPTSQIETSMKYACCCGACCPQSVYTIVTFKTFKIVDCFEIRD